MIRRLLSRLYWWAHRIAERRRMRKRLAELERRLANHDMDMVAMEHYPQPVQAKMRAYRERLAEQVETARRFV